jgi:hypothetical protein
MSGEAWSCFQQLPSGLIDLQSPSLSLRWLRPRPTHAGFKLVPSDVDEARRARMALFQRWSLIALAVLAPVTGGAIVAEDLLGFTLIDDAETRALAVLGGVTSVALGAVALIWTGLELLRYQQVAPAAASYRAAQAEFAEIDAWRAARCEASFWSGALDEAAFARECAELLAGHFGTGQVMLTRGGDDYGVDVLICSPQEKIVARCKPWRDTIDATQVRALAGAKAFFDADRAVMMTIGGPSDRADTRAVAEALTLELWDVARIASVAMQLRRGT